MDYTPVFNIPHPTSGTKANQLGAELEALADGVEAALLLAEIPPTVPAAIIVAPTQLARDMHWGAPASAAERLTLQNLGATTIRTDLGYSEQYYAALTDGGSNPGGRPVAGWFANGAGVPWRTAAGIAAPVTIAAGDVTNAAILFPAGRFTVPPIVIVGGLGGPRDITVYATLVTKDGFNLARGSNSTTSRAGVQATWTATQMTPTTAAG